MAAVKRCSGTRPGEAPASLPLGPWGEGIYPYYPLTRPVVPSSVKPSDFEGLGRPKSRPRAATESSHYCGEGWPVCCAQIGCNSRIRHALQTNSVSGRGTADSKLL